MPVQRRRNVLDNPGFRFSTLGASASLASLPAHGYVCDRWKVANTGYTGTVSRGTTPTDTAIPKWLRGVSALTLAITGVGTELVVRQTIEEAQPYARSKAVVSLIAFGPDGGSLEVGIGGRYQRVKTLGLVIPTVVDCPLDVPDAALTTLDVEVRNPSGTGTYYLAFMQATIGENTGRAGSYELPTSWVDRASCDRYVRPIGRGLVCEAESATRLVGLLPLSPAMRTTPTLQSPAGSVSAAAAGNNATVSAATATLTLTTQGADGARVIIDGFSGLTVGGRYVVTTTQIGVLLADY